MRKVLTNKPGAIALVMGLVIALAGGVAHAATQSTSTPTGNGDFTMTATVTMDAAGGVIQLCGGDARDGDQIEWTIGFGTNFMFQVNGATSVPYAPGTSYTVTVDCYEVGGVWKADTTVVDDSTSVTVFSQTGHVMDSRPHSADAEANVIDELSCE